MKSDKELLAEILPEMETKVKGLTELWPGREILTHLHRNERIVSDIKKALANEYRHNRGEL